MEAVESRVLLSGMIYTLNTLYTFDGNANGGQPETGLVADAAGNLYGTTGYADQSGFEGTVFEIPAGTSNLVTLHTFNFSSGYGAPNLGPLTYDGNGHLFGTTNTGGDQGEGSVFEVDLTANPITVTDIASFDTTAEGGIQGESPEGALAIDASGNIFGATSDGGANDWGTIFEIPAPAGTQPIQTILSFDSATSGVDPQSGLMYLNGKLYGTTPGQGGGLPFQDTVFQVDPSTSPATLTTIANLTGTGSLGINGVTADSSGNLYTSTFYGGDSGNIFELAAGTFQLSTLATLSGSDGGAVNPQSALSIDANGNLYGVSNGGGVMGDGAIFEVDHTTHMVTTIASLDTNTSGSDPEGQLLLMPNGDIYGTTSTGGNSGNGFGTVFNLIGTPSYTANTLASFANTNGSLSPSGGLVVDAQGDLFGITTGGGPYGDGTIFEVPAGQSTATIIASFEANIDGASPIGPLVIDGNGDLFGITGSGGTNDGGVIFEVPAGTTTITPLAAMPSFDNADGGLTIDSNGNLFGVEGTYGSVFELPSGQSNIVGLALIGGEFGQSQSDGGLTIDNQQNIFGTTYSTSGSTNTGTIFELASGGGSTTTIASFDDTNLKNGSSPNGYLAIDSSGNIFGTTGYGGAHGDGTVFEIPSGDDSITTLASFDGTDGYYPNGGLIVNSQGDLFGTTDTTLFELAAGSGTITTLSSVVPESGLVADSSGNLYGTTTSDGANGNGTVFEFAPSTSAFTTIASMPAKTPSSLPAQWNNMAADQNGDLFGITDPGGESGRAIAELKAGSNTITTLATLDYSADGSFEYGGRIIVDTQGDIFGATPYGGPDFYGTIFEIPAGTDTITPLASFDSSTTGSNPTSLVIDSDGNLFGATADGGADGQGTIFKLAAGSNTITPLASYSSSGHGGIHSIAVDGQGDVFGETWEDQTIIEVPAGSGTISTIVTLDSNNPAGYLPEGLVSDANGIIFGVTAYGGANGDGGVFEIASGTTTVSPVAVFDSTTGANTYAGLTIDTQGNIFGTTDTTGQLWELPAGSSAILSLYSLSPIMDGPEGDSIAVVAGANGNVYGLTPYGDFDGGALIEFSPPVGPPARLAIDQQPANATAGSILGPISVEVDDSNGILVSNDASSITISLATGPQGASLGGTLTVPVVDGVATFNDLSLTTAGSYTLTFSDTDGGTVLAPASSDSFGVSPAAAAKLAFIVEPAAATAGQTFSGISVAIEDQYGNTVTGDTSTVSLTGPSGAGLTDTLNVAAQSGVALFSGLSLTKAGMYSFSASDGTLNGAVSSSFTINPDNPSKLVFTAEPANTTAGVTLPAVSVAIEDQYGNTVTGDTSTVNLTGPSSAGMTGTFQTTVHNGVATFSDVSLTKAGSYSVSASDSDGSLTSATSENFNINAAAASKLVFAASPSNAVAGATLSPIIVDVEDHYGNVVITDSSNLTLTAPSGVTVNGTLAVAANHGVATFSDLSITTAGTYTLSASDGLLASGTSNSFAVTPGAPASLVISQQPVNSTADQTMPAVSVEVEDTYGNPTDGSSVTLALGSGAPTNAILDGTLTVPTAGGIATFSDLSLNRAGGYTLVASDGSVPSVTTNSFTMTYASPQLVFFAQPTNITAGAKFSSITVDTDDLNGNPMTSGKSKITLNLSSGGKLIGATTATVKDGVAIFKKLSVQKAGTYTLTASDPSFAPAQSTAFTVTSAAAKKLAFNSQLTSVAHGTPFNVDVELVDRYGNLAGDNSTVILSLGKHVKGAVLGGTTTATVTDGTADLDAIVLNLSGKYTLKATDGRLKLTSKRFLVS